MSFIKKLILAVFTVLIVYTVYQYSLRPFLINYKTNNVLKSTAPGYYEVDYYAVAEKFRKYAKDPGIAFKHGFNLKFHEILASIFLPILLQERMIDEYTNLSNESITLLKQNIELEPYYLKNYIKIGNLYSSIASIDEHAAENAAIYFEKAIEKSPGRQELYILAAKAEVLSGQYQKALENAKTGLILNPEYGEAYFWIGISYIYKGKFKTGNKYIEKAGKEFNIETLAPNLKILAAVYRDTKQFKKTISLYLKILEFEPNDKETVAFLAGTYKEIGEKEKAREWALKLLEIAPGAKEQIQEFLESL